MVDSLPPSIAKGSRASLSLKSGAQTLAEKTSYFIFQPEIIRG